MICVSRNTFKRHVNLFKRYYVLIKDFSTFMFHYTLHRERKHLCGNVSQICSTEEILKCYMMIDLKLIVKKIKMPKEGEHVRFKNYETKAKSPYMIYADF